MGDVIVMADPVHELPAAVGLRPAPRPVVAGFAVGEQRGRSAPEVVVEVGRRRLFGGVALGLVVTGGQAHLHLRDLADESVAHDLDSLLEERFGTLLRADLEDGLLFRDFTVDRMTLRVFVRHRLFTIDILARAEGLHADDAVPVVGGGDHHRVDVVAGDQLAEILVGGAAFPRSRISAFRVGRFHRCFARGAAIVAALFLALLAEVEVVDVTHRDALDVGVVEEGLHHAHATIAESDETHRHPFARGVLAEEAGGKDRGRGDGGGGLTEETAAGSRVGRVHE